MRVALVCDWLTEIGGAEQVLLALTKMFPGAPIYTSQYRPKSAPWFRNCEVRTGCLNLFPRCLRKFIAPLRALYFSRLKLVDYDVVISVANAEAKGIKVGDSTLHIAYLQGPPTQYYWGQYEQYIRNPGFGWLNPLARLGLKLLLKPMRRSDYQAAQRPDVLVANSHYVATEIKKYYHRDSDVLFPPVDVVGIAKLADEVGETEISRIRDELFNGQEFYLVAGRQVNWKRFDLAVDACAKAVENLLIIGDGPEHARLVEMAKGHDNIKFLPRYNGPAEIVKYYRAAKGLIFTSLEPFGIVPAEALAAGLPLLALHAGGALDIVEDGVNGIFYDVQTTASLVNGLKEFEKHKFNHTDIRRSAQQFDRTKFDRRVLKLIPKNCEVH